MNLDWPILDKNFKHIRVVYAPFTASVCKMVVEHYDTPEYDDTVFFLNVWTDSKTREMFGLEYFENRKKIYYFLEHISSLTLYPDFYKSFKWWAEYMHIDEIWSMELEINIIKQLIDKPVYFKPMRYATLFSNKNNKSVEKTIDVGFVGVVNKDMAPYRDKFLDEYFNYKDDNIFSIKILNGKSIIDFRNELDMCRFVLDLPRDIYNNEEAIHDTQNQVRIFEHLCMGDCVISKRRSINLFRELIYEFDTMKELNDIIVNKSSDSKEELYKLMTYTDIDYNNYINNLVKIYA